MFEENLLDESQKNLNCCFFYGFHALWELQQEIIHKNIFGFIFVFFKGLKEPAMTKTKH